MLGIGLVFLALAIVLLVVAVRGRVIARGVFCRGCRFDLQGLKDPAVCPECGDDLSYPHAIRFSLRRPRWSLLYPTAACVLFATALVLPQSVTVRSWLLPRIPDPAIGWLARIETAGAREELVARLSDPLVARPAFTNIIGRSLDRVLAEGLQARATDRAVIVAALRGAQFTDEQARRFFETVIEAKVSIRDKARPEQTTVPSAWRASVNFHRIFQPDDMFPGSAPAYLIDYWFLPGGPTATTAIIPPSVSLQPPGSITFHSPFAWDPSAKTALRPVEEKVPTPGDSVEVHAGLRIRVFSPRSPVPVASIWIPSNRTVSIVPPTEPLIPAVDDPAALEQLAETLFMRECSILRTANAAQFVGFAIIDRPSNSYAAFRGTLRARALALSPERNGAVFAPYIFPAQAPYQIRNVFQTTIIDPAALAGVDALAGDATADIVFRPDPQLAYEHAELESYLVGAIIFRNIPLHVPRPAGSELPEWIRAEVHTAPGSTPIVDPAQTDRFPLAP